MRKNLLFFALLLACTLNYCRVYGQMSAFYGQNQAHSKLEISSGYGIESSDQLFDGYMSYYGGHGKYSYSLETFTGPVAFSARYLINRKFAVGLTAAYENEAGDWLTVIDDGTASDVTTAGIGSFKRKAWTIAPECTFTYKQFPDGLFSFYCLLGMGYTYENEVDMYDAAYYLSHYNNGVNSLGSQTQLNNNRTHFNMQASQGIRFGRTFGGFIEAGIGYKGIVNAGLSLKL